jgi:hypothetical protein
MNSQLPPAKRRRFVPVFAGLAVVALIAASLVVYRTGQGVFFPVASTPEAVAVLNSMADIAEAAPAVVLPDGHLVHTESHGQAGACGPTVCQMQPQDRSQDFDPRQGVTLRVMDGERELFGGQAWAPPEVGIARPTREWLTSLPIDARELLAVLRKDVGHNDSWTVDHQLWDAMGQLYADCELALSAPQRAHFLRALAGVTGLTVRDLVVDGVPLVAIRQTDKDTGVEIIFDPATGHAVGRASVFLGDSVTIIPLEGAPPLDKGVMYQATWQQTFTTPTP